MNEQELEVKASRFPGAGRGVFTKVDILSGTVVCQYNGTLRTAKEGKHPLSVTDEGECYIVFFSK